MNNVSFAGGSLDVYKRIPEHVLGRIAVAVSFDEILCLPISILITEWKAFKTRRAVFWSFKTSKTFECLIYWCVIVYVCMKVFTVICYSCVGYKTFLRKHTHFINELKEKRTTGVKFSISLYWVKWRTKPACSSYTDLPSFLPPFLLSVKIQHFDRKCPWSW